MGGRLISLEMGFLVITLLSSFIVEPYIFVHCLASLTALFKHIESVDEQLTDENLRERTLLFIKDKVERFQIPLLQLMPCSCLGRIISTFFHLGLSTQS